MTWLLVPLLLVALGAAVWLGTRTSRPVRERMKELGFEDDRRRTFSVLLREWSRRRGPTGENEPPPVSAADAMFLVGFVGDAPAEWCAKVASGAITPKAAFNDAARRTRMLTVPDGPRLNRF